jgi:hypothetical protein
VTNAGESGSTNNIEAKDLILIIVPIAVLKRMKEKK